MTMTEPTKEIRCQSRILGIITDDGLLEVKCSSRKCGAGNGVVVFHYINLVSGRVVNTIKYKDPKAAFDTQS